MPGDHRALVLLCVAIPLVACEPADPPPDDLHEVVAEAIRWGRRAWDPPADVPVVVLVRSGQQQMNTPAEFPVPRLRHRDEGGFLPVEEAMAGQDELRDVLVCDAARGPREPQLCGRPPPWRVIHLDWPAIEGDSATIGVRVMDVEDVYQGGGHMLLLLTRSGGRWSVAAEGYHSPID